MESDIVTSLINKESNKINLSEDSQQSFQRALDAIQDTLDSLQREDFFLKGHQSVVTCCSVNSDGSLIASGSEDKKIKIWSFSEKEKLPLSMLIQQKFFR